MIPTISKLFNGRKLYPQWVTGAGVTIVLVEIGIMCGWSSPNVARLSQTDSPIPLTSDQQAWVASLLNLGRFVGAILGAIGINYIGSKRTLLTSIFPIIACWIFTAVANSYVWLYIARALGGVAMGMAYSCFPLFLGEVALPEIRGALVSLAMAGGNSFGIMVGSIGGTYLSLEVSSVIYLVPCVAVVLLFLWLPESPHWLVKIHDYDCAKRSIAWYQPSNDSDKELDNVKELVNLNSSQTFCDKVKKCKSTPVRKGILLIIVLFTFMQITGINSVLFYMETIIRRSKFDLIDPSIAVICVNAFGIVATAISMCLIDKCGRKFLLILSCSGVMLSMAALGTNSYLISTGQDVTQFQWLPLASVLMFIVTYFLGLMNVPSAILSEIFSSDIKSVAGCLASLIGAIGSFASTRSFQPMVDATEYGEAYVFWMHGAFALLLIPYVIFAMPETKGKSLQEIQNKFMR